MNIRGWGVVEVIAALAATTAAVWLLEQALGFGTPAPCISSPLR